VGAATGPAAGLTDPGGPFEIGEAVIRGVPTRVWRSAPPSLRAVWDASRAHGDHDYLVYGDDRITFADAHVRVATLAGALADRYGLSPGDRFAIALRNYPEWVLAFWAGVALGAVAVPLNAWWTGPELAYGLADSGARVLFADEERLQRLTDHRRDLRLSGIVAVRTEPIGPDVIGFDDLLGAADPDAALPDVTIDPDDDVTIMYTSGTTGRPKGAAGSHRNVCSFVMNLMYAGVARAPTPPPTPAQPAVPPATVLTFPLFHVGGLQSHLIPYTVFGGKLVLMYKWDADLALDLVEREQVTAFSGVPTTAFQLLETAASRGVSLPHLQGLSSGATLVPPELVRRIDEQFASRVAPTNGYGLTETTGAVVANVGAAYVAHPDSVGTLVAPVNEMRIVDVGGHDAAPGDVGEICFKGPVVVRGYFNNPEATAEAFVDGWFHTGDLWRVDNEFLYVVDRLKDVVIRGGENIYAAEVEAALFEHPDIVDAAIVGIPDPTYGEELAAVVSVRPGRDLDADGVRAHVAQRLAAFKVPTVVDLRRGELPRNAAGKVLKRQLRDELRATVKGGS
jgi:long-chain acyl-CoA synthetase